MQTRDSSTILPDYKDQEEDENLLLIELWAGVLRFKWLVAAIIAASFLIGLMITLLMTPMYTATARLEVSRSEDRVTNVEGVENSEVLRAQEYLETQYALLQSPALAERVVRDLDLINDPFVRENILRLAENAGPPSRADNQYYQRVVTNYLLDSIEVEPVIRSSLVDVKATSSSPEFSAKVANSWARQFIQSNIDRRFASTNDARAFLEGQLEELRGRLEQSERDLIGYSNQQGIMPVEETTSAEGDTSTQTLSQIKLASLNEALSEATGQRIAAASEARYSGGGSEGANNASILLNLRSELASANARYETMMTRFGPQYPAALQLQSDIAALRSAISSAEGGVRAQQRNLSDSAAAARYRQALARERDLQQEINKTRAELTNERQASIQYNIYQREVATNRELYNGLLQRYKEIGVAGVGSSNISVVDMASVPRSPSSPVLLMNLLLATVGGIAVSALTVLAFVQMDQTIRTVDTAQRSFDKPVLGALPKPDPESVLNDIKNPKTPISEAYQSLSTQLGFLTDHGFPRSLAFTSSRASEGKSVSAHSLSLILSKQGKRVLLVDADMRSPSVSEHFDIRNNHGLLDYLTGQDDWHSLIIEGNGQKPDLLLTGPEPPNAPDLLVGDRFRRLIKEAEAEYDHVLVDSPPVLGLADAPLIGTAVEGVLFAIEANGVKIKGIRRCLERLDMAKVHVFGLVITKMPKDGSHGDGYGYGYGQSEYKYGGERQNA